MYLSRSFSILTGVSLVQFPYKKWRARIAISVNATATLHF